MGTFSYRFRVGNLQGGETAEVEAMVDTGAADTMLPARLLAGLGVQPTKIAGYVTADGRDVRFPYGFAAISISDETCPCPVAFGPEGEFLLGATTLEAFKLMVDPNRPALIPLGRSPMGGSSALLGRRL